jgi:hypothetical protein
MTTVSIPKVGTVTFPAGMTQAQIQTAIESEILPKAQAKTPPAAPPVKLAPAKVAAPSSEGYQSSILDFPPTAFEMLKNFGGGGVADAERIAALPMGMVQTPEEWKANRSNFAKKLQSSGFDPNTPEGAAGGFATNMLAASVVPPLLGMGATAVGAPAVANALRYGTLAEGGGFFGNLAKRLAAGGTTGGAMGIPLAQTPQDVPGSVATGMAFGAGLTALSPMLQAAGWIRDVATGRLAQVKAGKIIREAASEDLPAIEAAMRTASPGVTSTQAASDVIRPEFFALGENAMTKADPGGKLALLTAQEQAAQAELSGLAGGTTQTEARTARELERRDLNATTAPQRDKNLGLSNVAGTMNPVLERQIEEGRRYSSESVAAADQMSKAAKYSQNTSITPFVTYKTELATKAGALARDAESKLQAIKDMGLAPLDTSKIERYLIDTSNSAGVRDTVDAGALEAVAAKIRKLTAENGGVMDARDLYTLRKTGVGEVISENLKAHGLEPLAENKRIAKMLGPVKDLIDEAIEAAGGKGWTNYLKAFSNGAHEIEQKAVAAKALEFFQKEGKEEFLKLVRGNNPKAIEKVFGPGSHDIVKEMSGDQMEVLQRLAKGIERDTSVKEMAALGQSKLADILKAEQPWYTKLVSKVIGAKTGVSAEEVVNMLGNVASKGTKNELGKAFLNPKDMLKTLEAKRTVVPSTRFGTTKAATYNANQE